MNFIGRGYELGELEAQYNSNQFELTVMYGRRRVGRPR